MYTVDYWWLLLLQQGSNMIYVDCLLVMVYLISTIHFKVFIGGTNSYHKQTEKERFLQSFFRIYPVIWKANMSEVLFFEVSIPWTELKGLEPHGNDRIAIVTFFSNVFWCLFSVFHMNKRYVYIYILIISSSKIFVDSCPPTCHVKHYFSNHVFQAFEPQRIPTSQLTSRAQPCRAAKSKASKASKATKVRRCQQEWSPLLAVLR